MGFEAVSKRPSSTKAILAHIEPLQRVTIFKTYDTYYKKKTKYFTSGIIVDGVELAAGTLPLSAGQFYFDANTSTVYFRLTADAAPGGKYISLRYRMFFSDMPTSYLSGITSGSDVTYEPLITGLSDFTQELDEEQTGVPVESRGSITLQNSHGFFDLIFDQLTWENAKVSVYSYLPESGSVASVFSGRVTDKKYSTKSVTFNLRDYVSDLKKIVPSSYFAATDGAIDEDVIGKPKRVIYGKARGVLCEGVDKVLGGYSASGTISGSATTTITGSGTSFLSDVYQEDEIIFNVGLIEYKYRVESVASNTSLTISEASNVFSGLNFKILPKRNTVKNREFLACDHKIAVVSSTITSVEGLGSFTLASVGELVAGDHITIGSQSSSIRRVSGNKIILNTFLSSLPTVGQTVSRLPVFDVYALGKALIYSEDYTISNLTTGCKITLNANFEYNRTTQRKLGQDVTWTNGSNIVTGATSGNVSSFRSEIEPGDYVRSNNSNPFYKVIAVNNDSSLTLASSYTGGNLSNTPLILKKVQYMQDDDYLICSAFGRGDESDNWIKTPAKVVRDLIKNQANLLINEASFSAESIDHDKVCNIVLPANPGSKMPTIREVIEKINKSVFGSLSSRGGVFYYDILDAQLPTSPREIFNDDIYGDIRVNSKTQLLKKVTGRYSFFDASRYNNDPGFSIYEHTQQDVSNQKTTENNDEFDFFLYDLQDAKTLTQRLALFRSVSSKFLDLDSNLYFVNFNLNEKVLVSLDRFFVNKGSVSRNRYMLVNSVSTNGTSSSIVLNDLAGWVNNVARITPNTAVDFTTALSSEKLRNGYIVENDDLTPNGQEDLVGLNLIG